MSKHLHSACSTHLAPSPSPQRSTLHGGRDEKTGSTAPPRRAPSPTSAGVLPNARAPGTPRGSAGDPHGWAGEGLLLCLPIAGATVGRGGHNWFASGQKLWVAGGGPLPRPVACVEIVYSGTWAGPFCCSILGVHQIAKDERTRRTRPMRPAAEEEPRRTSRTVNEPPPGKPSPRSHLRCACAPRSYACGAYNELVTCCRCDHPTCPVHRRVVDLPNGGRRFNCVCCEPGHPPSN